MSRIYKSRKGNITEERRVIRSIIGMICVAVVICVCTSLISRAAEPENAPRVTESGELAENTPDVPVETTEEPQTSTEPSVEETDEPTESAEPTPPAEETPTPTPTPTPTVVVTPVPPTRTPVLRTVEPGLSLITPPALPGVTPDPSDVTADTSGNETGETTPDASGNIDSTNDASGTGEASGTHVGHIEQEEIDTGFRMSDFIEIVCYCMYGAAGLLVLLALVRVVSLLVFKKDIWPSKADRDKKRAEKEAREGQHNKAVKKSSKPDREVEVRKNAWDK